MSFTDYREGWSINPQIIEMKGVPHIEVLDKENSFIYREGLNRRQEIEQQRQEAEQRFLKEDFLVIEQEKKISINNADEKTNFDFI